MKLPWVCVCGGGGGGGVALIFVHIYIFGVQHFEFQYFGVYSEKQFLEGS